MTADVDLPKVSLSLPHRIRLIVVGILVAVAIGRVVPDVVRAVYPLSSFGYITDGDGRVISVPSRTPAPGADAIRLGDRILISRIRPFDRKPGLVGFGYTHDNPDRHLPVLRNGRERVLHLVGRPESAENRFGTVLRIVLFVVAVSLGAIMFLVKPRIATAAFFVFCLGALEAPTTYIDLITPNPWRPIPEWIGFTMRGAVRPALMLFAFCLIDADADAPRERAFTYVAVALGAALGTLAAYADWSMTYAGWPAQTLESIYRSASFCVGLAAAAAFALAFVRAGANDRHRIGWIVVAFAFAGVARLISDASYPGRVPFWFNSILVSTTIVPIVVMWIAVVRHRFFNVDFVVSRAVVYTAITAAPIATIWVCEEFGTYLFYNNTDLAYLVLIPISMAVGAMTGRIGTFLRALADRLIFRERHEQRMALELIAGYILDAEHIEDIQRALLQDASHALQLSFGGIFSRTADGSYLLTADYSWPEDCLRALPAGSELISRITSSRGAMSFSGKETRVIQELFPAERLAFAAPLLFDRIVSHIVIYGHNISGLDLDPEERELLVRVVAHASIALTAIELAKYRSGQTAPNAAAPSPLPSLSS